MEVERRKSQISVGTYATYHATAHFPCRTMADGGDESGYLGAYLCISVAFPGSESSTGAGETFLIRCNAYLHREARHFNQLRSVAQLNYLEISA